MQDGARYLTGRHDFSAFRAAGCQATTAIREIMELRVERCGDWLGIRVKANAFLQHMVRNIAGTLATIGAGERPPQWAGEVLDSRNRSQAGVAAPAHGLTLVRVDYPDRYGLPTAEVSPLLPGMPLQTAQ
jgi:tRNA pseudouridine38-40 synthase